MKLLILGASGGCGRWLVRLASQAGDHITALVRPSAAVERCRGVEYVRGEVLEPGVIERVAAGHDAVLCALGLRRAGPSPWAALRSPADMMARTGALLAASLPAAGVSRLVVISAGGVGESDALLTAPVRWLVRRGNIGVAYRDLAQMERELQTSSLDWLAVRPVTLLPGGPTRAAVPTNRYGLMSVVRRADVASYMLERARRTAPFAARAVMIGAAGRAG
ncbi:MAG: NAD(P)H-binding protein [Phycisphaeraceae bacterium]|nr:NAD(P)H-binding protein [Phycisphaeraceae bacterium]